MILAVTNQDWADEGISYSWDENMLTITHNLNDRVFVQLYDTNNRLCILDLIYIDSNNIAFDFSILGDNDEIIGSIKPADGESYTILISPVSYSVSSESSSSIGEESSSSSTILAVTNQDWTGDGISYSWDENMLTITHNLNDRVFVQVYEPNNRLCILDLIYIDSNNIAFDFSILDDNDEIIGSIKPADGECYTILISPVSYSVSSESSSSTGEESSSSIGEESSSSSSSFSGELPEFPISNPLWEHEYYAGTVADLALFCKSLSIGGGRLAKITDAMVQFYLQKTDDMFDGYLIEYYFLPIRRYNRVLPNGQVESVFPGVVRKAALQISASMLLASEFQNLEPNTNEAVTRYMEEGRKELYAMTLYNQRIPGQRWKSAIGKTFPPTMQPAYTPELTI